MKKLLKYGLGGLVAALVVVMGGWLAWSKANEAAPAPDAVAALRSDDRVSVEDGEFIVFRPAGAMPTTENGCPLSTTGRPTTVASPPNSRSQSAWPSTVTGCVPGV